jgi:hypothetical protein
MILWQNETYRAIQVSKNSQNSELNWPIPTCYDPIHKNGGTRKERPRAHLECSSEALSLQSTGIQIRRLPVLRILRNVN